MPRILTQTDISQFRDRLCDVAATLYAEVGDAGFNMRELARRMGVSAMTPYRYFRDKDEVLQQLQIKAFGRLADLLEEALGADDDAAAGAPFRRAYLEFALQERFYYRLMFDIAAPRAQNTQREERRIRAAFAAHAHSMGLDGDAMGPILWSTLHGIAALHLTSRLDAETIVQFVPDIAQGVLVPGGCETRSAPLGWHPIHQVPIPA